MRLVWFFFLVMILTLIWEAISVMSVSTNFPWLFWSDTLRLCKAPIRKNNKKSTCYILTKQFKTSKCIFKVHIACLEGDLSLWVIPFEHWPGMTAANSQPYLAVDALDKVVCLLVKIGHVQGEHKVFLIVLQQGAQSYPPASRQQDRAQMMTGWLPVLHTLPSHVSMQRLNVWFFNLHVKNSVSVR